MNGWLDELMDINVHNDDKQKNLPAKNIIVCAVFNMETTTMIMNKT